MVIKRQENKIPYYEDLSRLNKSMLNIFRESPAEYKRQCDNPVKLDTKALRQGSMIHKYILEHEDFWNEYYRQYSDSPTKSANQKAFAARLVEECFDRANDMDVASAIYRECYSTDKLSEKAFAEKLEAAVEDVFEWVKECLENPEKLPVTQSENSKLQEYVEKINQHKGARMLLQDSSSAYTTDKEGNVTHGEIYAFSEFHINWEHESGCLCKSLIDRVVFHTAEKKIWLIDLKTTYDSANFIDSYTKYTYGMQMAFYRMALRWFLENELGENPDEWIIECYIITIQKDTADISVFSINCIDLKPEEYRINGLIEDLGWHKKNNIWNMSRFAYENNGIDKLIS